MMGIIEWGHYVAGNDNVARTVPVINSSCTISHPIPHLIRHCIRAGNRWCFGDEHVRDSFDALVHLWKLWAYILRYETRKVACQGKKYVFLESFIRNTVTHERELASVELPWPSPCRSAPSSRVSLYCRNPGSHTLRRSEIPQNARHAVAPRSRELSGCRGSSH